MEPAPKRPDTGPPVYSHGDQDAINETEDRSSNPRLALELAAALYVPGGRRSYLPSEPVHVTHPVARPMQLFRRCLAVQGRAADSAPTDNGRCQIVAPAITSPHDGDW